MNKDKLFLGLSLGLTSSVIAGAFIFVGVAHGLNKKEAKSYEQAYALIQELGDKVEKITEVDDIFEFVESANQTKAQVNGLVKKYDSRGRERIEDSLYNVQRSGVNKAVSISYNNTLETSNYLKVESSGTEKYKDGYLWKRTEIKAKEGDKAYYGTYETTSDKRNYQTASKPASFSISHKWSNEHGWTSSGCDTQTITSDGDLYGSKTGTLSYNTNKYNFLPMFYADSTETILLSKENGVLTISTIGPVDRESPNLQRHTSTFTIDENDCLTNYFVSNCSRDCYFTLSKITEDEFNQVKETILAKYDAIELSNNVEQ